MLATGLLMTAAIGLLLLLALGWWRRPRSKAGEAPGPRPWPLIGSLHLLATYKRVPFEAFTALQREYGPVVQIQMGSLAALVVSEEKDRREMLLTKGDHFDRRPDWIRFEIMFGGNKNNSLAFCDMSALQSDRRRLLAPHTFPAASSLAWRRLDSCCREEAAALVSAITDLANNSNPIDIKPLLNAACANIFNAYFCTTKRREYSDQALARYCQDFDKIFWEVNNGRAMDVLPWLAPMMAGAMAEVEKHTASIREYVMEEVVRPRVAGRSGGEAMEDMLDAWLDRVEADAREPETDTTVDMECALYALEDILGGHSAVANIALRALIDLGARQEAQAEVRGEVRDALGSAQFSLEDRRLVPVLTACFYETVRLTCSPSVPHVAGKDTTLAGYTVPAGTLVFVNNHATHFSEELWEEPAEYRPARFLAKEDGAFHKPQHFQPFSAGRRSCMGYKMVEMVVVSLLASLTANFTFSCDQAHLDHQAGMLALPIRPYMFSVVGTRRPPAATPTM